MIDGSLLTKCPHCQTLFRIQQEHLAAADGEVRCGVCYKVFDAKSEGLSYNQGEDCPAEKTFANNKPLSESFDEVIDTSPELTSQENQNPADLNLTITDKTPSLDEIRQLQISSSPVSDIIRSETNKTRHSSLKWTALSLLASIGLLTQWLTYNFEDKAHQAPWHAVYASICQMLGCELPHYQNISEIKTERLAIKTHPEFDNVLIIDMIINNSAAHTQPLPVLDMTFYTINGAPLAQRLFKPEEYLGQHLKTTPLMPSKTPLHLSFAILDPGSKAVNYSISLMPAS